MSKKTLSTFCRFARILSYIEMTARAIHFVAILTSFVVSKTEGQDIIVFDYLSDVLDPNWKVWYVFMLLLILITFQLLAATGVMIATHVTDSPTQAQPLVISWMIVTTTTLCFTLNTWIQGGHWIFLGVLVPIHVLYYGVMGKFLHELRNPVVEKPVPSVFFLRVRDV